MGLLGIGLAGLVPATIILAISFFVLVALQNARTDGLKKFGYVMVALLWLSTFITLAVGIQAIVAGRRHLKKNRETTAPEDTGGDSLRDQMRRQMQKEMQ